MNDLDRLRQRHFTLKMELLKIVKQIDTCDKEDIALYQDVAEQYAKHLRAIGDQCKGIFGVSVCNCTFHPEACT
ncbi:hypothetical protein PAECIP111893_05225 [Paenibacillus plantiphilus]|uniref:Uncharacterized protein n=1 Tax=Paenibacillus plantiphilus TaxID=2905650 RepID=A0ABM9CVL9_9BACL|nr:hypothetical protein [Paenibacillus plantiphilus]CAH1225147.1 hypothetical protein PAECIP111893_05225 [Paenibacillus plantiphilus]